MALDKLRVDLGSWDAVANHVKEVNASLRDSLDQMEMVAQNTPVDMKRIALMASVCIKPQVELGALYIESLLTKLSRPEIPETATDQWKRFNITQIINNVRSSLVRLEPGLLSLVYFKRHKEGQIAINEAIQEELN